MELEETKATSSTTSRSQPCLTYGESLVRKPLPVLGGSWSRKRLPDLEVHLSYTPVDFCLLDIFKGNSRNGSEEHM